MKNVYLCGFMGCGKSTAGKLAADLLGCRFIDADDEIVRRENRSIPDIFAQDGEPAFREMETALLRDLSKKRGLVVATGGGMMVSEKNAAIARSTGRVLLLEMPFEVCYERIRYTDRPLVINNTKEQLRQIFADRQNKYRQNANVAVDANCPAPVLAARIAKLARRRKR